MDNGMIGFRLQQAHHDCFSWQKIPKILGVKKFVWCKNYFLRKSKN